LFFLTFAVGDLTKVRTAKSAREGPFSCSTLDEVADFGKCAGEERTQHVLAREIALSRAADNPRQTLLKGILQKNGLVH
jgi:hypothetical protein